MDNDIGVFDCILGVKEAISVIKIDLQWIAFKILQMVANRQSYFWLYVADTKTVLDDVLVYTNMIRVSMNLYMSYNITSNDFQMICDILNACWHSYTERLYAHVAQINYADHLDDIE